MKIIGVTEDKKYVMDGVFEFYDTYGFPLLVLFSIMNERGFIPCWNTFVKDAQTAGWKNRTIASRLSEALTDVYGEGFRTVVMGRLAHLLPAEARKTNKIW
jgi:alanyl-tRNA synthetase